MSTIYLATFISIFGVSLISLIGVFMLSLRTEAFHRSLTILISIAAGALLGDAFIHLIPDAFESALDSRVTSLLIILGIAFFFVLEKFFHWHHHGEDAEASGIHPVGKLVLLSDLFHNLMDGIIIAAGFMVSLPAGIATTLAVVLHEIPQEIGDFAVLVHAGFTRKQALAVNFLTALSAFLGAFLFFLLGATSESVTAIAVPVVAGGFIYIAAVDLIPELQKTKKLSQSFLQFVALLAGVLAMLLLVFLE